ncbi:MAG: apolipoprotein N-acyltransferase [Acidobacteriota bacterium]|nr:apolipoprotein N-acyltransferase [Acidobacteriota bacterium]
MTYEQSNKSDDWIHSCVVSGLLLGLSFPTFAFAPLSFLAWTWLVPLLFELGKTESFGAFFKRALLAVGIGFSISTLWVVNASFLGFLASAAMGTFIWTLPFLWFYWVKKRLNWNAALLSLPFFWTAWEWLYHQTAFSFGAVRLGYTQAEFIWLIQYADITGVEGVTFWLVSLNVALYFFISLQFAGKNHKSNRTAFLSLNFLPLVLLFALPLAYAAAVFLKPQPVPAGKVTVLAVQPNVSPFVVYSPKQMTEIYGKQFALTDKAFKTSAPDLILWHEAAIPYVLSENAAANNFLAKHLTKWNAPLLTGLIEVKNYADGEPRPPLLVAQNRNKEFFNAAALFQPADVRAGKLPTNLSEMYQKRRLMPFLEQVPFSEQFASLADLTIPIGARPRLSAGKAAKTFDFRTQDGVAVRVGTMICYENLYPEMSTDLVRGGAQILTAITNEGFFANSQGQNQLAAFARFRAIETRRAVVRAAATGMTQATDRFGRVMVEVPAWSEQTLLASVELSDEQTIYVRWGNFFPKICALFSVLFTLAMIRQTIRRKADFLQRESAEKS